MAKIIDQVHIAFGLRSVLLGDQSGPAQPGKESTAKAAKAIEPIWK